MAEEPSVAIMFFQPQRQVVTPPPPPIAAERAAALPPRTLAAQDVSPLTPDQLRVLSAATAEMAKFRRASKMAGFNGVSMLVSAGLCAPFVLFSLTSGGVAAGLLALGLIEMKGRAGLRRLRPAAARLLAWNQLATLAAVFVYCGWSIYSAQTAPDPFAEHPELQQLNLDLASLQRTLAWVVYGTVAAGAVLYQGLCGRYYLKTAGRIEAFNQRTPSWVRDALGGA